MGATAGLLPPDRPGGLSLCPASAGVELGQDLTLATPQEVTQAGGVLVQVAFKVLER